MVKGDICERCLAEGVVAGAHGTGTEGGGEVIVTADEVGTDTTGLEEGDEGLVCFGAVKGGGVDKDSDDAEAAADELAGGGDPFILGSGGDDDDSGATGEILHTTTHEVLDGDAALGAQDG